MPINFDNAIGIHERALGLREQRAEVLANNLANADTPNFLARDVDFASVLKGQVASMGPAVDMMQTEGGHQMGLHMEEEVPGLMYRQPLQPSLDGNTVDEQTEQAAYAKNALDFQASFTLLNRNLKALAAAFRGD